MSDLQTHGAPLPLAFGERALALYDPVGEQFGPATESAVRRYWAILTRHRLVIIGSLLLCVALALLATLLMQREYTSVVRIQIARQTAKIVDVQGVEDEQTGAAAAEFYQTQYALLQSRSLAEAVVGDLGLADNYVFLADYDVGSAEEMKSIPRTNRIARATRLVEDGTSVTPVRGSSIIDLSYESPNPVMSASIANSLAENFIQSNLTRRFEAAAYARQFLQNRLNQVRGKLEESERKAVEYAQQQGLVKIDSGTGEAGSQRSLIASQLSELSSQLTLARAARVQAEAQYRAGTTGSIAAQSLLNSTLNQLRGQRAELLGQLSKLQSDFGAEYPTVVALKSQIGELDRQIAREQSRVGSSVTQDLGGRYRQALAAERSLQSKVDALKGDLLGEQSRSIQFNIIQRDVDTNRALYEALLQRFKEIGVAGGVGTNNVSIVDRALPSASPSSPNLPLNLALGFILGLILGAGAAMVLEQLAEAMILPGDFQRKLGLPLLGATPAIETDVDQSMADSKSQISEAYFSILTSIQFSTSQGSPPSILVTSSQGGEGKSTTALALARALASVGSRVLLIDADMRKPSLHRTFERPLGKGLSDLLTHNAELKDVVQQTDVEGLSVVLAGPLPPNPAELLATQTLGGLVKTAGSLFDHIVIDGPPVLGLADAPLLSRAVEGTVFVVEFARTRAPQARQAIARIRSVRGHMLGAVLTKLNVRSAGYGAGYGYDYYHYGAET